MDTPTISIGDIQFGVVSIQFVDDSCQGEEMKTMNKSTDDKFPPLDALESTGRRKSLKDGNMKNSIQWTAPIVEEEEEELSTSGTCPPTARLQ